MARTNPQQLTEAEIQAAFKFCTENDIPLDDASASGIHNQEFLAHYFLNTWKEDLTEQNLKTALPVMKPHLRIPNPDEQALTRIWSRLGPQEQWEYRNWSQAGLKKTTRNNIAILN